MVARYVTFVRPTRFTRCTPAAAPALKNEPRDCASVPPYGGNGDVRYRVAQQPSQLLVEPMSEARLN